MNLSDYSNTGSGLRNWQYQPATIKVVGVGSGGCNAVRTMVAAKINEMPNVQLIAVNTDKQALAGFDDGVVTIQIGEETTKGLGAGGNPEAGKKAVEESHEFIKAHLEGADMVILTTGMGGGTGSGATPAVAKIANEMGILTVGIITLPYSFEKEEKKELAKQGVLKLREFVDSLLVIENDKVFDERLSNDIKHKTYAQFLSIVDDVLLKSIQAITIIITHHGIINRDFADIKKTLSKSRTMYVSMGESLNREKSEECTNDGTLENAIEEALDSALNNPFVDGNNNIMEAKERMLVVIANPHAKGVLPLVKEALSKRGISGINSGWYQEEGLLINKIKIAIVAGGFETGDSNISYTEVGQIELQTLMPPEKIDPDRPAYLYNICPKFLKPYRKQSKK
ncbi:MAG: cell division FtsZ family protein [Elusimicrobiota bacterium]|jgi:cell division protein FtsZ|nr:cell division FtsZ family protein [Elusimicrobiota bacterium]